MQIQRHVVLVGMGRIGRSVLNSLPHDWNVYVIDKNINQLNKIPDDIGGRSITKLCEDATSRLVLKGTNLQQASLLAVLTKSDEANGEIVRLARSEFQVDEIFVLQNAPDTVFPFESLHKFSIHDILAYRLSNQMQGGLIASGVGLEQGEIRQVSVLSSSAARGQTIQNLKASKWLIAAIYRDEKLLLPQDDTTIKTGDDILVVGHPEVLKAEINFLRGGQILFPTQYGNAIGMVYPKKTSIVASQVLENTNADSIVEIQFTDINPSVRAPAEIRQHLQDKDVGLVVIPPRSVSWFALWGFTVSSSIHSMFSSQIPFLVMREASYFKKVLLAVGKKASVSVLSAVAMDIVRQFDGELTTLTIYPPNIDKNRHSELEGLPGEVEHIARSHGLTITKQFRDGNPIKLLRSVGKDFDLMIIGYAQQNRSTFGKPDISLHLLHKAPCSILFVPWQTAGR